MDLEVGHTFVFKHNLEIGKLYDGVRFLKTMPDRNTKIRELRDNGYLRLQNGFIVSKEMHKAFKPKVNLNELFGER